MFRAKFSYSKFVKRGYKNNWLLKYFKKFCSAYDTEGKYGKKNSDLLFLCMLKHNPFVSCNINNTKEINDIVKASCVKLCHLQGVLSVNSIATITKLRSLELLIKTPLLHILYYINGLTHDFWTRTGGWEFDHSHGAGTSSPSHWQQVEKQAPKPVGWTMCFLLMTLVPVQKLCVDIYVYIYMYVHSLYEFCYRSYIQRECHSVLAKLHPITFYRGVRGSWAECHFCFLWFTNCVLLFDKNLILGC